MPISSGFTLVRAGAAHCRDGCTVLRKQSIHVQQTANVAVGPTTEEHREHDARCDGKRFDNRPQWTWGFEPESLASRKHVKT